MNERKGETIARFLAYARERLEPLGVRISAAVFGLAATRDLGIGQRPRLLAPYLDAIYPMVYPSHYSPGEYNISTRTRTPARRSRCPSATSAGPLRGMPTRLVPWLQDFTLGQTYTLAEVQAQIKAARRRRRRRLPPLERVGRLHRRRALEPLVFHSVTHRRGVIRCGN